MRISADLRAMREDDDLQRAQQRELVEELEGWRLDPATAPVFDELERFARRGSLAECPHLSCLFDPGSDAADRFCAGLFERATQAMRRRPLGHVPFRHFCDDTLATLQIARSDNAMLVMEAIDGDAFARLPEAQNVEFSPSDLYERTIAGSGSAEIVTCENVDADCAVLHRASVSLQTGTVLKLEARRQAVVLRKVTGRLVVLRLRRREPAARPSREFRLCDGALVHQAAGSILHSRIEMMMALLGQMKWQEAAPLMARIAQGSGPAPLRWQALRECLALDTGAGFAALSAVARSVDDELAPAAGALRSQLIETYPQLEELARCPA